MTNSGNKVILQTLVKEQLKTHAGRVQGGIKYHEGDMSINLSTGVVNWNYVFKNPKADTMLLSAYAKLSTRNYTGAVVLNSEDTDIYVQTAYVSQQLRGDLLNKRKNAFINCHAMLSEEVVDIIRPLRVITDRDHTSGCYGHRKSWSWRR